MSETSRERILSAIRWSVKSDPAACAARIARHAPGLLPARGRLEPRARIALFVEQAKAVNATVTRTTHADEVPGLVASYLDGLGFGDGTLPRPVRIAPHPWLMALPWDRQPDLAPGFGAAGDADAAGVALALFGVAETGTLVMGSGPTAPSTLNFLPDAHMVVLRAADVVPTYEDAFARLRAETGADFMPRTVNWITGPSRTADIEQTLLLGVHGPRRLHIVLVDGPSS